MQKPHKPEDWSNLEQIPISAVENQMIESGVLAGSLQNQILAIAFFNTLICLINTVVLQRVFSATSTSIIALVTGVSVGITTFALGRLMFQQITRNLEHLKGQTEAVVQDNFSEQAFDLYTEFMPLKNSLQQITEAMQSKSSQVEEQSKQNEYLEEKLLEIVQNLDLTDERRLLEEGLLNSDHEQVPETPTGSLLEFLDNFHKWSQLPTAPELLLGSSSIEEIQQRKEQLQYRQVWLQAILEETQREIKFISPIAQLEKINED